MSPSTHHLSQMPFSGSSFLSQDVAIGFSLLVHLGLHYVDCTMEFKQSLTLLIVSECAFASSVLATDTYSATVFIVGVLADFDMILVLTMLSTDCSQMMAAERVAVRKLLHFTRFTLILYFNTSLEHLLHYFTSPFPTIILYMLYFHSYLFTTAILMSGATTNATVDCL